MNPKTIRTELVSRLRSEGIDQSSLFKIYLEVLRSELSGIDVSEIMPGTVALTTGDWDCQVYLENLWIETRLDRQNCEAILEDHINAIRGVIAERSEQFQSADQVMPIIKGYDYIELLGESSSILTRHLAADFSIIYGFDQENRISTLCKTDAQMLHLAPADVHELAIMNLQKKLPSLRVTDGQGVLGAITCVGPLLPSILLMDGIWDDISQRVTGDLVIAVPSGEAIFFSGSHSPEGIEALGKIASRRYAEDPHPISSTLLRRSGGQWQALG